MSLAHSSRWRPGASPVTPCHERRHCDAIATSAPQAQLLPAGDTAPRPSASSPSSSSSRDPKWFPLVLNFLRDGFVPLPPSAHARHELRQEAHFFCLQPLVEQIEAADPQFEGWWGTKHVPSAEALAHEAAAGATRATAEQQRKLLRTRMPSAKRWCMTSLRRSRMPATALPRSWRAFRSVSTPCGTR